MPELMDELANLRFTQRARQALQYAEEESQALNHAYVGTEHILLGLLREGAGVAARVLNDMGVALEQAREAAAALSVSVAEQSTEHELTSGARYVINNARSEATRLHHQYVGTEHLLLGLVHKDEGVVSALLMRLGVSLEQVRDQVLSVVTATAYTTSLVDRSPTRAASAASTSSVSAHRPTPEPAVAPSYARLTTHVLDTARGRPAANIQIELWSLGANGDERHFIKTLRTNADGRTDEPLLVGEAMSVGVYELIFVVGDYFADAGSELPFLDRVPIRFGIGNATAHYHIPLLVSPWAYSTYRGS